jgi:hypothetical protein
MLRKAEMFRVEPVPTEVRTCVSDIIARLECPAILEQHDPHAADKRSRAVLQTLQDTRDRMALEAAFEAERLGREMLDEQAKYDANMKDLDRRQRKAAADDLPASSPGRSPYQPRHAT